MVKILFYIIIFFIIYKVIQVSLRVFSTAKEFKENFYRHQEQGFSEEKKNKEGETYITYVPEKENKDKSGKNRPKDGEYIDYEEVK